MKILDFLVRPLLPMKNYLKFFAALKINLASIKIYHPFWDGIFLWRRGEFLATLLQDCARDRFLARFKARFANSTPSHYSLANRSPGAICFTARTFRSSILLIVSIKKQMP